MSGDLASVTQLTRLAGHTAGEATAHTTKEDTVTTPTTTAPQLSGETIGLMPALHYTDGMRESCDNAVDGAEAQASDARSQAEACRAAASSIEQSVAHMQAGEVGETTIGYLKVEQDRMATLAGLYEQVAELMNQAQDGMAQSSAGFGAANGELSRHLAVKDAYDATPDAGSKQFVRTE